MAKKRCTKECERDEVIFLGIMAWWCEKHRKLEKRKPSAEGGGKR